jgi:hypothetical protein
VKVGAAVLLERDELAVKLDADRKRETELRQ